MDEKTLRAAGIDYDAALARFVGRRELYEKFLHKFLEDTHEQDAVCAYRERQFEETLAQVHALKGVCGTLGLTKLYESSARSSGNCVRRNLPDWSGGWSNLQRNMTSCVRRSEGHRGSTKNLAFEILCTVLYCLYP